MLHIFHVLLVAFNTHHPHLLRFYLRHHAVRLLMSGWTSETPRTIKAAVRLLWWLVFHKISPVDW